MAVDYRQLRNRHGTRNCLRADIRDGFYLRGQKGSHQRYRHSDGRMVTVSFHRTSDTFPPKTLRSIVDSQAHWAEEDLRRLGLMR